MKKLFIFLLFTAVPLHAAFLLQPHDVLAICGDSITEQKIYSVFIEDYLLMCQPTPGLRIVQLGWSGERAGDLLARLDSDLFPFKPTAVTTCYGMNDGQYQPMSRAIGDAYRQNMDAIVAALKKNGVRAIVVGGPGAVDPAGFPHANHPIDAETYNQTLGALGEIARDLAQSQGTAFADVHTTLLQVMEKAKAAYGGDYPVCGNDGVHPGPNGHLVMAYAFLKALGCDGAIGTLTVDWGAQRATATPGQKIISYQDGVLEVESIRYPFCVIPRATFNAVPILKALPFNEDLNRYLLVVRGLNAAKVKVTWGSQSKEFDALALANGINLAEAFPNNPFADRFQKVDALVQLQQAHETFLVKTLLHNFPTYAFPGDGAQGEKIRAASMALDQTLFDAAAGAVVPVRHTLRIETVRPNAVGE